MAPGTWGVPGTRWGQGRAIPEPGAVLQVREELERRTGHSLAEHKDFIDNEMLLVLAQMDRPSRVFPHLFLVGSAAGGAGGEGGGVPNPRRCHRTGLRVERSQPGGAAAEQVSVGAARGSPWGGSGGHRATAGVTVSPQGHPHPERGAGDRQLLPGAVHLHERAGVRRGGGRAPAPLERHLPLPLPRPVSARGGTPGRHCGRRGAGGGARGETGTWGGSR